LLLLRGDAPLRGLLRLIGRCRAIVGGAARLRRLCRGPRLSLMTGVLHFFLLLAERRECCFVRLATGPFPGLQGRLLLCAQLSAALRPHRGYCECVASSDGAKFSGHGGDIHGSL
jgi:hypothetical protein